MPTPTLAIPRAPHPARPLAPPRTPVWHELAGAGLALRCADLQAGPERPTGARPTGNAVPLPEGAVGELLLRAVQAGLVLRVRAMRHGRTLERIGPFDRLSFDGRRLRVLAGADRLVLHEALCPEARCFAEVWRSGLRHRIELFDAGHLLRLRLDDGGPADRPESCTWRALVQSLLPAGGLAC